jgi:2-polyprenyl-3-methyl-5-hydroxy-6-metoxy-1,4-benzoquinol methylase
MGTAEGSEHELYAAYASHHVDAGRSGRPWFPVLDHIPADGPLDLLDLGCGDGALLREAARRGLGSGVGVDRSPEQVARARAAGSDVREDDAIDFLSRAPAAWDVITCVDLLEHLEHDAVLALAHAVAHGLRPGGAWVVQVPNAVSPFFGNYAYGDFTHRTVYTHRSLEQIARVVGLEPVAAHPVAPPPGGVARTLRRIVWAGVSSLLKLALAAETGRSRGHIVTQNLVFVARAPERTVGSEL